MAKEGLRSKSELFQRVVSGMLMASAGILVAWLGDWPFALVWSALAIAVAFEWGRVVGVPRPVEYAAGTAITCAFASALFLMGSQISSPASIPAIASLLFFCVHLYRWAKAGLDVPWLLAGLVYTSLLIASVLLIRGATQLGFVAILFLFAVVWMTDIGAYFAGRKFGGPKFAPTISPKKTWSGVVGGLLSGTVASLLVLAAFGVPIKPAHIIIAILLGISVVYGDLFESYLKRRFGVKDAGSLIPGHGGFLDRLDGFTAALVLAAIIGVARAGWQDAAIGLLNW